jgi:hypothetical protein
VPPRGHLLGGLVTRHEKTTPLLCRASGPFHGLSSTARLPLYIGVVRVPLRSSDLNLTHLTDTPDAPVFGKPPLQGLKFHLLEYDE